MRDNNIIAAVMAACFFSAVFCAPLVLADEKKNVEEKKNADEKKQQVREPIIITSKSMTTDQKAQTALFEGNVVARKRRPDDVCGQDARLLFRRKGQQ